MIFKVERKEIKPFPIGSSFPEAERKERIEKSIVETHEEITTYREEVMTKPIIVEKGMTEDEIIEKYKKGCFNDFTV